MSDFAPALMVPASGWINTALTDDERFALMRQGILPVNDVFCSSFNTESKINLLYGGMGSGKSDFVATRMITQARQPTYYRGIFGTKVFDKVRKSCHAALLKVIQRYGWESEFKYSEQEKGNLDIRHRATGNLLLPYGADNEKAINGNAKDKSGKLKLFDDVTEIWMEEGDQFDADNYGTLLSRLRTKRSKTYLWITFNTEKIYPRTKHWILTNFFPELCAEDAAIARDQLQQSMDKLKVNKVFCNYTDNFFIDHEEYYNTLVLSSGGNRRLLEARAKGAWGVTENGNPWLHAFDYDRHVYKVPFLPDLPVYLSFDFNNDPFACIAFQMSQTRGDEFDFIHIIGEFVGSLKVEEMCQRIKTKFPASILYITGDRSGSNDDLGRNQTLYQLISSHLGVSSRCLNLNNINLSHADSRLLCNVMFHNYPHIGISPDCAQLIADIEKATIDMKNDKPSKLLKDRENYKMDAFDAMRYFFQTYWHEWATKAYMKALTKAA